MPALPYKIIDKDNPIAERVLQYNPDEALLRVKLDSFKRIQNIRMSDIFPKKKNGLCDCGCGKKLTGRQRRWASLNCQHFAYQVYCIFYGRTEVISTFLMIYYGNKCADCGGVWHDVDHIIPIKYGGGGRWLDNYQLLCHDCHVEKTKKDFGWKQKYKIK